VEGSFPGREGRASGFRACDAAAAYLHNSTTPGCKRNAQPAANYTNLVIYVNQSDIREIGVKVRSASQMKIICK